jgi:hypothetical protein
VSSVVLRKKGERDETLQNESHGSVLLRDPPQADREREGFRPTGSGKQWIDRERESQ